MSHGHSGQRKPKKHHEEEHENHERWLVSYADMMTLLMVLFIVMFAISAVDQHKFAALKDGLAAGFGSPLSAMDGGTGPLDDTGTDPQPLDREFSVTPPDRPGSETVQDIKLMTAAEAAVKAQQAADDVAAQKKQAEDFKKLEDRLSADLKKQGLLDKVAFKIDERGLIVTVITDKVIFAPDEAKLQPTGARIISIISPSLKKVANNISVEGHTSTEKVRTKYFASDWALSAERSSAVVDYMVTRLGFDEHRISPRGWGHTRPAYPGRSVRANNLNRRVEIIITSGLKPSALAGTAPDNTGAAAAGADAGTARGAATASTRTAITGTASTDGSTTSAASTSTNAARN